MRSLSFDEHLSANIGQGLAGVIRRAASLAGTRADAVVHVDTGEHARRRAAGVTAVTSLPVLGALLTLPVHEEVRLADLSRRHRELVERAGPGAVEIDGRSVTRRLVPAASVPLVVVRRRGWRQALAAAGEFSTLRPTVVLLDREPGDWRSRAWEADLAGVGVLLCQGAEVETLLRPRSGYPPMAVRPARWRFLEHAYLVWLTGSTHRSAESADQARRPAPRGDAALGLFDAWP
jgi:hypothetical protein